MKNDINDQSLDQGSYIYTAHHHTFLGGEGATGLLEEKKPRFLTMGEGVTSGLVVDRSLIATSVAAGGEGSEGEAGS